MKTMTKAFSFQKLVIRLLLPFIVLALTVNTASAVTPDSNDAFVYAISAFDGQVYRSSFAPANTETIYLMAGENNVLSSKKTEVYFWPLTQTYNADWLAQNDFVDGTLEILQGNKVIQTLQQQPYVIQYDSVDPVATRNLAYGDDADAAYENFLQQRKDYQDRQSQYTMDYQAYSDEVSRIVSEANGEPLTTADFPSEPETVPDFTLYSTEITNGFVFALPAGDYSIRLRLPDGSIQDGSEKGLVVFTQLRQAISYKVIPAERWTAPDYAQEPDGVIYAPNNSTLYLVPYMEYEYNQQAYQRMIDPQETESRADQRMWVSFDPYSGGQMIVLKNGTADQAFDAVAYYVSQSSSSGLGYDIELFDGSQSSTPSFTGYRLDLTAQNPRYQIALRNADGSIIKGSERQVRVLNTYMSQPLYAVAFLPLLAGFIVIISRRASVKKIKIEG